jgi:2-C-methyl-D-erythritol 4-phosphate cytidylyltransferase
VQTPQAFERQLLLRAHAEGERSGFGATDDAGLVWRLGHPIEWVLGGSHLFKVTTAADLALAEAVAATRPFGVSG